MSEFFYMVWYFIEQVATWTLFVLLIVPCLFILKMLDLKD